jgi:hypothetical protein
MTVGSGKVIEALDQELKGLNQWIATIEKDQEAKLDAALSNYRKSMQEI